MSTSSKSNTSSHHTEDDEAKHLDGVLSHSPEPMSEDDQDDVRDANSVNDARSEEVTDSEEDEEEDDEPALKYERLGGVAHELFQKDSASALTYSNKRLVS